ncbi:hypothetical protein AHF37_03944 [Paragonimus kellicotti]|nr:hypothetical protein AHF37_03944 [Paragonimus kellicotti]
MSIDAVRLLDAVAERRYVSSGQSGFTLALYTKLFCIYELTVPGLNDARALQQSLEALINIVPDSVVIESAGFRRGGRFPLLVYYHRPRELCSSYPEEVIVPAEVPDSVVIESAGFRRGGRFPLLVYYHRPRETALLIASEPATAQSTASSGNQGLFNTITTMTMPSNPMRPSPFSTGSPQRTGTTVPPSGSSVTGLSGSNNTAVNRCRADEQFLASVLLDRHSFQDLVEHNWLRSGHPFGDRCRHSTLSGRSLKHEAPVFLLFLDSVWQLWRQYPTVFEFTDELLCLLAQHVYYSEFGTFLGNSMKERDELGIHEKTASI